MTSLRICLDARLISGTPGGVEQFIIGLAYGFSKLTDGDEEYLFLAYPDSDEWIRPYMSGPCRILHGAPSPRESGLAEFLRERAPLLHRGWKKIYPISDRWKLSGLLSDGTIEKAGVDVMHFTHQVGFRTRVKSLYHPHDLEQIHFPEHFSRPKRLMREALYRFLCRQATLVPVGSSWMQREVVRHYGLPPSKVPVVPMAPPIAAYPVPSEADISATNAKYQLPDEFVFYPAQTVIKKNHLLLLEALARIRDEHGMKIQFVSSGQLYQPMFDRIREKVSELELGDQTRFLGFVSPLELQCLYRRAKCVVVPTRYEAGSFPLFEAFSSGVPVACSNVTSLPEQVGDAALVFDPEDTEEMAGAIHRLWTDESLRKTLIGRGLASVSSFSWEQTARIFRAHYRRMTGQKLGASDEQLLQAPALI